MERASCADERHHDGEEGFDGVAARVGPEVGDQTAEFGDEVGHVAIAGAALVVRGAAAAGAGEEGRRGAGVGGAMLVEGRGGVVVVRAVRGASAEEGHSCLDGLSGI